MNIENEKIGLNKYRQDILFVLLLLLLTTIFFWKVILHPDQIISYSTHNDLISYVYPFYYFADTMLKTGNLPFWNPYTFCGNPFIANPQIAMFYPLNNLLFIIPTYLAFGYSYLLHIFLGGLYMYIFTRHIKLDKVSSFLSSIIFMFSGFVVFHTCGHHSMISVAIWIPLIFLLFETALTKRSLFYGLLTGIPIGIQFLAGHLQISFYILFALALYLIFRSFLIIKQERDYRVPIIFFSIFILASVVGILLSAIQLIPSFELSKYVTRAGGTSYDFATSYSFPLQNSITFVLPNFFGNPTAGTFWNVWNYYELSQYIGILPLILVFIAIYFKRDNKYVLFFTGLAFLSLLFALGRNTPVYWLLWKFVPGFDMFRCPSRFLFLFAFSASILSGFGFSFLRKDMTSHEREKVWKFVKILIALTLLLVCVTIIAYAGSNQIIQFGQKMVEQRYYAVDQPHSQPLDYYFQKVNSIYSTIIVDLLTLLALSVGSVILLALRIKKRIPIKYFNVIVILFILSNLWFYHIGFIDTKNPQEIYSESDYVVFLKNNSAGYRIYNMDNIIHSNFQMIYGIHTIGGYEAAKLKLRHYSEIFDCINISNENHPILNLLNVKYVLTSKQLNNSGLKLVFNQNNTYIYENEQVLPKAFVIHEANLPSSKEEIIKLDLKDIINNEKAEIEQYSPNEVIIKTNLSNPGFLVLSEVWYPNWKAYIDNETEPTTVYKAYHTLMSVYLSKGEHTVKFVYDPSLLRIGAWISFLTIVLLVAIIAVYQTMNKKVEGREIIRGL